MDERLEKALAFSKYRVTIENKRKALKRRFETMLVVHENNGMFRADQSTISFVASLLSDAHNDAILIDTKSLPIEIDNLNELYSKLMSAYFEATNEYSTEMKKLSIARNVKKAMDW